MISIFVKPLIKKRFFEGISFDGVEFVDTEEGANIVIKKESFNNLKPEDNHIDLSNWIESKHERWGESYQLTENTNFHPSGLYYNKLSKEVIKKLKLNLQPLGKDRIYHPSAV